MKQILREGNGSKSGCVAEYNSGFLASHIEMGQPHKTPLQVIDRNVIYYIGHI